MPKGGDRETVGNVVQMAQTAAKISLNSLQVVGDGKSTQHCSQWYPWEMSLFFWAQQKQLCAPAVLDCAPFWALAPKNCLLRCFSGALVA